MEKIFTTEEIIGLYGQVTMGEISFSRMVEILNERVSEAEDVPEELKKGDLAIFWDDDKEFAALRFYEKSNGSEEDCFRHKDQNGFRWRNAIKFESKEQYERLIKGEI